jgi:DNA-directed RNA polymerase sigma subunit (sigma70/sigma32)
LPDLEQVEAASAAVASMRRELEARERRVAELEGLLGPMRDAFAGLESQLAASRQRVRELEAQPPDSPLHAPFIHSS